MSGRYGAGSGTGTGGYAAGTRDYDEGFSSYHAGAAPGGRDNSSEFGRLAQSISSNIQKISQNVSKANRFISQIGTASDSEQVREELHQLEHYTNQLTKETTQHLKDMVHLPQPPNPSEQRQRKMQRDRLTEDFGLSLNKFKDAIRAAAEKERESITRARTNSGLGSSYYGDSLRKSDDQLIDLGGSGGQRQSQQVLQMEEDVNLELIQEREEAVKKLEADILGVNEIFKELGVLVHEQGEVIDSIEAHVESTQIRVQEGTQQLEKARDYSTSARRKKCIIIIIILVVLAIIGVIIGVSVGSRS